MYTAPWLIKMWDALQSAWCPEDPFRPDEPYVREYYMAKARIAANLQPTSICEFGSRAGYSLFAMAYGLPEWHLKAIHSYDCNVLDIPWQEPHAKHILGHLPYQHHNINTQLLCELPQRYDLVHVDAGHSYAECLNDTILALTYARYVLVDDFHVDTIEANEIREAAILAAKTMGRCLIEIPDSLRGQALIF